MSTEKGILQITLLAEDFSPELLIKPPISLAAPSGLVREFNQAVVSMTGDGMESIASGVGTLQPASVSSPAAEIKAEPAFDIIFRPNGLKKLELSVKTEKQEAHRSLQDLEAHLGIALDRRIHR